jgi:hypothetical protein
VREKREDNSYRYCNKCLCKTLKFIISSTSLRDDRAVGITAIGGVEAVVKVLQNFPKCHDLQWRGCRALHNFVRCSQTSLCSEWKDCSRIAIMALWREYKSVFRFKNLSKWSVHKYSFCSCSCKTQTRTNILHHGRPLRYRSC